MRNLNKAILAATTIEEVCVLLAELSNEVRGLIEQDKVSADGVHEMAASVTQLRVLLEELVRNDPHVRGMSRQLAEYYLELEGKLKEIRNDLDRGRTGSRTSPEEYE